MISNLISKLPWMRARRARFASGPTRPPRVSVVVPIYNKASFLGACLESIQTQSLHDIEIICVDDGSTDASAGVISKYASCDERMVSLKTATNLGPGGARNLGLARASGEFLQFTDADDLLPRDALRTLYELARTTGAPVVRGSLGNLSAGVEGVWSSDDQTMPDRRCFSLEEERKLWVPYFHVCYLYRRQFLVEHNIQYPRLRCGEDPIFLAACLLRAPMLSTSSAVTYISRRDASGIHERATFTHVMDFISNVAALKRMYLESEHATCWSAVGEQFFLDDTLLFVRAVSLAESERDCVVAAMREIWGTPAHELKALMQ